MLCTSSTERCGKHAHPHYFVYHLRYTNCAIHENHQHWFVGIVCTTDTHAMWICKVVHSCSQKVFSIYLVFTVSGILHISFLYFTFHPHSVPSEHVCQEAIGRWRCEHFLVQHWEPWRCGQRRQHGGGKPQPVSLLHEAITHNYVILYVRRCIRGKISDMGLFIYMFGV